MIAGVEKICKKQVEINKSKDKYNKYRQLILCKNCSQKRTLPEGLKQELLKYDTIRPYDTRILAEKYSICPKSIQLYFAEKLADIIFITYAMLPFWKKPKQVYPFVIYDEARHFIDLGSIELATVKLTKDRKPSRKECINAITEMFLPIEYLNATDQPEWYEMVQEEVKTMSMFIIGKLKAMYTSELESDESEEEYLKKILEYKPRWVVRHTREYPPGCFLGIHVQNFLDDYVKHLDKETIQAKLYELIWMLIENKIPKHEENEVIKTIDFLNEIQQIAGCSKTELELLRHEELGKDIYHYVINLKPFTRLPKINGSLTFFLEGTPFPPELYEYWLGIKPQDMDVVSLPSQAEVIIIFEDVKRSTKQIYSHGDNSEQFKRHIKLIKELTVNIRKNGYKTSVVARTKEVNTILGSNGVKAEFVCGDKAGEGIQLDTDVLILEGTQIRNIGVDKSRRFTLARYSLIKSPVNAHQEYNNLITLQTMVQSVFRGVDRTNKRRNIVVLLGNMMPNESECWIERAKNYWSYLKEDNVKYVRINGRQGKDNEIKEIMEVTTNNDYDYNLSPYQNQIIRYVKGRPNHIVSKNALVNHFLGATSNVIKRTKADIYHALKQLIKEGYLVVTENKNTITVSTTRKKSNP